VKVVINRWQLNTDYLLFAPDMWKRAVLRDWFKEPLAKIGDSERVMIVGEFSLQHMNQKGSGIVRKSA
jgi:hypothetical protein